MKWRMLSAVLTAAMLAVPTRAASLNEVRIDQVGADSDEYVEIAGSPGESLDGLYVIVIGDDSSNSSGVVEVLVPLNGYSIPSDGYFLIAETSFTLSPSEVDRTYQLPMENSDNVTVMLVRSYTGGLGQDIDTDDDGVLDVTPWDAVLDRVALIEESNPPSSTEYHYGPPTVGPDGGTVPYHAYRTPNGTGTWCVGAQDVAGGTDTPGSANFSQVALSSFSLTVDEDGALTLAESYFAGNFTDATGVALATVSIDVLPINGDVTLGGSPIEAGDQVVAAGLDSLEYIPAPDWNGTDSLTWNATAGTVWAEAPATVTLNVLSVNDDPIAGDDSYGATAGDMLHIDALAGLLSNDSDADGNPLSASSKSSPAMGTLTLASDGSFSYEANPEASGVDSFTYSASDGVGGESEATVTIDISPAASIGDDDAGGCVAPLSREGTGGRLYLTAILVVSLMAHRAVRSNRTDT